jgi:hypothetical protein
MVEKEPTQEFTMSGLEATTFKAWRNSRDSLQLTRLIARRTKILIGLAAVAVTLLAIAIFMLWRVLKQLG